MTTMLRTLALAALATALVGCFFYDSRWGEAKRGQQRNAAAWTPPTLAAPALARRACGGVRRRPRPSRSRARHSEIRGADSRLGALRARARRAGECRARAKHRRKARHREYDLMDPRVRRQCGSLACRASD